MSNELIVLEEKTALSVLTSDNGVELLIEHVRDQVMNLEGGNLKSKAGRAKIKSNAFKATKAKTASNAIIDDLINQNKQSIADKTKVEVETIEKLKASKVSLGAGLDSIRKDVNAEVQKIEDDIQAEIDRLAAEDEAKRRKIEIDSCIELAHYMNADFDKAKADYIEAERLEKEERDRKIAEDAKAQAKLDAQAEIDAANLAAKQAEELRIKQELQAKADAENAELKRKEDARLAEVKRLADIEKAKQDAIDEQEVIAKQERAKQDAAAANEKHVASVHSNLKSVYVAAGFPEDLAVKAVKLLVKNKLPGNHVIFNY